MGLHSYATASSANARELALSLSSAEVISLASELKTLGYRNWLRWRFDQEVEIQNYVCATPATRAKRVKWRDSSLRSKLVLGAVLHCQCAELLLRFLAENEGVLSAGGSYRDTTALAGSAYLKLMDNYVDDWPEQFALTCPSPF